MLPFSHDSNDVFEKPVAVSGNVAQILYPLHIKSSLQVSKQFKVRIKLDSYNITDIYKEL